MINAISGHWAKRAIGIMVLAVIVLALFAFQMNQANAQTFENSLGLNNFSAATNLGKAGLPATTAKIINGFISILGVVAVVIILIGGFKWMTSGGNDEKVGEAKQLILAGVIGLIIVLAAYAIARFVIDALTTAISS